MITARHVCRAVPGLSEATLLHWMEQDWVRPERSAGEPDFGEIDIARARLILELRTELEIDEPTLPLVLSLLDQLYATRRALRAVLESLEADAVERLRAGLPATSISNPQPS